MQIFILSNEKLDAFRMYLLSSKDKQTIDEKFNRLYIKEKML